MTLKSQNNYSKCWLDYRRVYVENSEHLVRLFVPKADKILKTAISEYKEAVLKMTGIQVDVKEGMPVAELPKHVLIEITEDSFIPDGGYSIQGSDLEVRISAGSSLGILYAVFAFARQMQMGCDLSTICLYESPKMPLRIVNHWDNMDGSIERGYSGNSFFYMENQILMNERIKMYARLMASIGINAVVLNNVNVHKVESYLITSRYLGQVKEYADLFRCYGIKLFLCVNFAAPMEIGMLPSCDPLEESVMQWWKETTKYVYEMIPDFGGYVVKADSEGRPGPFTYGRTQADGANMLAHALQPFGGLLIWRCFVYNCGQDWRDKKTDRACAAYDYFMELDGSFSENVILQIKNGPMDFQVREPVSPLFGGLEKTNSILEVQIAQEYTGQQIDVCYLVPMWKEILDFPMYGRGPFENRVLDIISGKSFGNKNCGMAGVINTGDDYNWTGNDLAAANLYGYGRLCFSPGLAADEIAKEWICMTFGSEQEVVGKVTEILMQSWPVYEKYTAPLGIGWMVTPHFHYGPDIDGYEYDRWGTYHRADRNGIGIDRTSKGTGFCTQYHEPNSSMYEEKESCPDELVLFFHYMHYDEKLKSGKTVIQHIYDTHFEGVEEVEKMIALWKSLEGKISEEVSQRVSERFQRQLLNAKEWRDCINTYFYRKSGIADEKHRKIYE